MKYSGTYRLEKHLKRVFSVCFDFTIICNTLTPTHTLHQKKILLVHILGCLFLREWIDRSIHTYIKSNQILKSYPIL